MGKQLVSYRVTVHIKFTTEVNQIVILDKVCLDINFTFMFVYVLKLPENSGKQWWYLPDIYGNNRIL